MFYFILLCVVVTVHGNSADLCSLEELRPKHLTDEGKNPNLANLSMSLMMNNNNNGVGVSLSLAQIVV